MAMRQCGYLAKGAKRPSHTTNMLTSSDNNRDIIADVEFFVLMEFLRANSHAAKKPPGRPE